MKKNYFSTLFAALMLFVAMPASAQVSSVADLFGKYKFTADMKVADAGKSLTDHFTNECDVVITECSINVYDGEIQGLAGATAAQKINDIYTDQNAIKITNPNGNGLWGGGLYMSDENGAYPFAAGAMYGDILYTYDATTKTITLPTFTLVTCNHGEQTATIVATFTNAKLTLVEAANIELADLSGDWHYTAGKGTYDTMEGSELPLEWDMTLTSNNDGNSSYDVNIALGDFDPLTLTGTFDGVKLTIPFDSIYFDEAERICLWDPYGGRYQGKVEFNLANENLMTLSMMYLRQDSISPEFKGGAVQYYMNGSAKRASTEEVTDTWDGVYNVKGSLAHVAIEDYEYPTEFEIEVQYFENWGIYLITKIFGNDVTGLNNGGIRLTPSTDDPNKAEITTGGYLKTIVGGESYLCLKDMNLSNSPLTLTRLEDGTYTISDFSVSYMTYGENYAQNHEFAAFYQSVTAEKVAVEEPEPTPFVWESTFTITADVQSYNDAYTYPTTFEMTVKNWGNDIYTIVNFMGYDISSLNGGAGFNVKSDTEAEIKAGSYIGVPESGRAYFTIADMNNQPNNVKVTVNEDGTLSIDNFCVNALVYDENWNSTTSLAAFYTNVKSVVEGGKEEEEKPVPFVWESTFTITADVQSYNEAYTYPTTFEMTVKNWGNDIYTIVNFMGYDISGLNGGAGFNVKSDSEAEIKAGSYIGVPESGKAYFTIADMNNQPNNVKVTVNEDGTLSIDNFCVNALVYDENWNSTTSLAAFYTNVKAVKNNEDSAINNIVVTNNTIEGIFDLTGRKLEAITTPGLYIVNGKKVVVK